MSGPRPLELHVRRYFAAAIGLSLLIVSLPPASTAGAAPTCTTERWCASYDGPKHDVDDGLAVAFDPEFGRVFVAGVSTGLFPDDLDMTVVAYDAATGTRLWTRRYAGAGEAADRAVDVVVAPDGTAVFITGTAYTSRGPGILTISFDAATGRRRWLVEGGTRGGNDAGVTIAMSPSGAKVIVGGSSDRCCYDTDYYAIAYDTADGTRLWANRYDSGSKYDEAAAAALSPDGRRFAITGASQGPYFNDFATAVFRTGDGHLMWDRSYNSSLDGNHSDDFPTALAWSPDSTHLYVTGWSSQPGGGPGETDYLTIAYDAGGADAWTSPVRYDGGAGYNDKPTGLVVAPDGASVFITGKAPEFQGAAGTVAYRATDGAKIWSRRFASPTGPTAAQDLALSPDGSTLFVAGNGDYLGWALLSYSASSGQPGPVRTRTGRTAEALVISYDGGTAFVTGEGAGRSYDDMLTVAWDLT
jgi:hypothetical protein